MGFGKRHEKKRERERREREGEIQLGGNPLLEKPAFILIEKFIYSKNHHCSVAFPESLFALWVTLALICFNAHLFSGNFIG